MVQVVYQRTPVHELSLTAEVVESRTQVGIFPDAPAFVVFVEAVDPREVVPPDRQVAAEQAVHFAVARHHRNGQPHRLQHPPESKAPEQGADAGGALEHGHDLCLGNECAPALHEVAGLGERFVIGNTAGVRQAIAIEEDDVFARGEREAGVEDSVLAKSLVRMPAVQDRNAAVGGQRLHQHFGLGRRAVVGDQDLVWNPRTRLEPFDHALERPRVVVGADDDAGRDHAGSRSDFRSSSSRRL